MIYKYQTEFKIKKETNEWHDALKWNDTEEFIKSPKNDETWNFKNNEKSLHNIYIQYTCS